MQKHGRKKELGQLRKEGPAAMAGVGKAEKAGRVSWVRWQGLGQITQSLLGSGSGAGFILSVVSSYQRGEMI